MSKSKKPVNFKAKYITLGIVVALLVAAIILFLVFMGDKDAKAIMTMETNPGVQLVLDENNKVVGQVAINADGESLLAIVSFIGLSAEDAAKLFAQASTEWGKINTAVGSDGQEVTITISAEKSEDYAKLANSVKSTVNKYFSENGIIAGAVTSVSNDVKAALTNMGVSAKEYANKTTQEMIDYAKKASADLEKIAYTTRTEMQGAFDKLYGSLMSAVETGFEQADELFTKAETALNTAKAELDKATDATKVYLQTQYDLAKTAYDKAKAAYDEAKAKFEQKRAELEKKWAEQIAEYEKAAEEHFAKLKTEMTAEYKTAKAKVQQAIEDFNKQSDKDKAAIQANIKKYQDSLTSSSK